MKTKKYLMISALALLAYSCQTEEFGDTQPTPGKEVQFGASLEQSTTRTIYGDETNNAFPINWINGDEVVIFSPDCASNGGVGSATYKVNVGEENSGKQNYANSLDKTGDIGVRWGDNATGSFYSIYPASSYTKVSSDCKTVTLTMPAQQDNNFERTSDGKIIAYPDMRACFMYAYTPNVQSGNTVDLKYKPLSTAIRFTLQGPQNASDNPVTITYVRIYAPSNISINGTYTFDDVTNGSGIPQAKNGLNYVTMNVADAKTGAYLTLAHGESVELNIFLLTGKDIVMDNNWYIEVGTGSGQSYKMSLAAIEGTNDVNRTLKPGMIHRLPTLPPLTSAEWSSANWMANLQRNVYLSEISLPGSWYSLNSEYQDPATIDRQYASGIRAFHLDTRWKGSWTILGGFQPTELGVVDGDAHTDGTGITGSGDKFLTSDAPSFADALKQITDNVKDDEYMVVMCTFAQGSVVTGDWRQAISDACASNSKVIEASSLNPNTVVGDVLGKVIVIVNTYTEGPVDNSKCLFFNMGITLDEQEFMNNDYYKSPLQWYNTTNSGLTMYGTHAQATTNSTTGSGSNDRDRGYMPSFLDRENKAQNILTWSKNNYNNRDNYSHDNWIYLGLGGYIPGSGGIIWGTEDDCSTVANVLNNWIDSKVKAMETEKSYYPIGIVLMNYANDYSHVVSEILMMNNKYRKAYDPNRSPVDGSYINGTGSNKVHSAAQGYSSGMKDNNTNAIGWTRCR